MAKVLVHWEHGVCNGYSDLHPGRGGYSAAAQQAADHMRAVLKERYLELGNIESIELVEGPCR